MTTTLIPETAPFSGEQRAWLNGFLAGWTGLHDSPVVGDTNAAAIALESLTGMASPGAPTEPEEEFPWHDDSLPMDKRLELAEGKPLERRLMASMAQLDCGACGYVCKTYSEAIASGAEKNLTLCSPGGKETAKMVKKLLKEEQTADGVPTNGTAPSSVGGESIAADSAPGRSRANPFPAKIKEVFNLNGPGSAKQTSHVVIDLAGSGLDYRVGDALGVFPTNCLDLVEKVMHWVRFDRNNGVGGKLRAVLMNDYDLNDVREELLEHLVATAADPEDKLRLSRVIEEDSLDELDVLDLLQLAPSAQLDPEALVERLNPMNPRLYSIASSLSACPDEVHLTIARVTSEAGGRLRKGVASTMFADRLLPGDTARVFLHAASDFTVPSDSRAPMIMVGPGTGVAPFRAFLQERQTSGATGKNWLFYGDQHAETDFLYRNEFEELTTARILHKLSLAFSRDQEQKIYVQDRMREEGAELFEWLEAGGYFFVCGDARRMAADVDGALRDVVATHGKLSEAEAKAYVSQLKSDGRYVRDVY